MNRVILREFHAQVDELDGQRRALIASAHLRERHTDDLPVDVVEVLQRLQVLVPRGLRKRLDYAGLVIALYGVLEDYVERLVEHLADGLGASVAIYAELPRKVRESNERQSMRLLDSLGQGRYQGPLTKEEVVARLHECLTGRPNFRLCGAGLALHTANVRVSVVNELFGALGVTNVSGTVANDPRTGSLLELYGRSPGQPHFYVDDLAARRNEVAHGEAPSDVLSLEAMAEYIHAVRVFGHVLFDAVLIGMCRIAIPKAARWLGVPTALYQRGSVVCFKVDAPLVLDQQDVLIWCNKDRWRQAAILGVEVDGVPHGGKDLAPGQRVGVQISGPGSATATYWSLPS